MSSHHKKGSQEPASVIHQYYMDIINCVPDVVYWIDTNCNLMGCNNHFVRLIGLNTVNELKGSPYVLMKKHALWSDDRIEALKLDDMNVIFSGEACHDVTEKPIVNHKGKSLHFKATRVPMYDVNKNIVGLIVVLTHVGTPKKAGKTTSVKDTTAAEHTMTNHRLPTVLMIEDNLIAQNVERALLTALNCLVDIADTGDKAIELFNPGKYDLVLMDIGLEDTSGYVVAKRLRNIEKNTEFHVPIIALTGYEADVVKYDCNQYFMEGAITKPLTSEQADQIIKHYVYHQDIEVSGLKSI